MNTPLASSTIAPLSRIVVLATGGTIAGASADATRTLGYQSGVLSVERLLDAVPGLAAVAAVRAESLASIDSKDMSNALWLTLARRINALLASAEVDGVVVTHGTDTLEETAYWLHLTVKSSKPVVLTGAMRPATALSADGPLNLFNAVVVASCRAAHGQGVLVVFNNQIHCARDVTKGSTYAVDAFRSPELGALGWVQDGLVEFQRQPLRRHTQATGFDLDFDAPFDALPTVELVTSHAGAGRAMVDALLVAGVDGIVVAGTGNGSLHTALQQALADAVTSGIAVVRASRVGSGHVMRNGAASDDALGFVSAGSLNPYKARVLLMLALTRQRNTLQQVFEMY